MHLPPCKLHLKQKKICLSNALEVHSFLQVEMKFPFDVCIAPKNEIYVKFTQINAQSAVSLLETLRCEIWIGGYGEEWFQISFECPNQ